MLAVFVSHFPFISFFFSIFLIFSFLLHYLAAKKKLAGTEDADKKAMYERLISQVEEAQKTLQGVELIDAAKDVLMEWLDIQFGSQVGQWVFQTLQTIPS